MCKLFIGADTTNWMQHTRSLRIGGVSTSLRMEAFFWDILDEIAFRDGLNRNQIINRLYSEALDADYDLRNFTSFLRVCCGRYLSLISDGELERDAATPLSGVDAPDLLARETARAQQRAQMRQSRRAAVTE